MNYVVIGSLTKLLADAEWGEDKWGRIYGHETTKSVSALCTPKSVFVVDSVI